MLEVKNVSRSQEQRTTEAKLRLREAALTLFSQGGYGATTLAAISVQAGFSRTLALYHYKDKAALALEILEEQILRDNHITLTECPKNASAKEAWEMLQAHLEVLTNYYGNLHGNREPDVRVTGTMAIHSAALTSRDKQLSVRVEQLSREQVTRIERILEICQQDGFIKGDTDIRAIAVLYVHSVWGLAQALFASPQAKSIIMAAFKQFGILIESLRIENLK